MPAPVAAKTWTWITNQRSVYSSVLQSTKDILYGFKTGLMSMSGATVVGSSIGATSSMDAVDRWTSASVLGSNVASRATAGATWFVADLANMGVEVILAMPSSSTHIVLIACSATGYSVSSTATPSKPADEVPLGLASANDGVINLHSSVATYDRIWNFGYTSDGAQCIMLVARANAGLLFGCLGKVISAVVSPATFSPEVVGFCTAPAVALTNSMASFLSMANNNGYNGNAYVNNGATSSAVVLMGGTEAYGGDASSTARITWTPELQGGDWLFPELSVWTETGTHRGKVGNLIDVWGAQPNAKDGNCYPDDDSREFQSYGAFAFPWNGDIPVLL